jgi:hypothetical protein
MHFFLTYPSFANEQKWHNPICCGSLTTRSQSVLSYPEWIATCIQLKNLEKYLLLLNRNLTKCKDRFELGKENLPLSYTRIS